MLSLSTGSRRFQSGQARPGHVQADESRPFRLSRNFGASSRDDEVSADCEPVNGLRLH
jgi:hypothetical protein